MQTKSWIGSMTDRLTGGQASPNPRHLQCALQRRRSAMQRREAVLQHRPPANRKGDSCRPVESTPIGTGLFQKTDRRGPFPTPHVFLVADQDLLEHMIGCLPRQSSSSLAVGVNASCTSHWQKMHLLIPLRLSVCPSGSTSSAAATSPSVSPSACPYIRPSVCSSARPCTS
jgi:hypothetical protein